MPLTTGFPLLINDVRSAYLKAHDVGTKEKTNSDQIITTLATDLATAIHKYCESAQVMTSDTVVPGQVATGPFGIGNYTAPGVAMGTGNISFKTGDISSLREAIARALKTSRDAGTREGADSDAIISVLAADIKTAIHEFVLTAKVETDIIVVGGVPVIGYLTPTLPPVPLPSISGPGTGKGSGFLS